MFFVVGRPFLHAKKSALCAQLHTDTLLDFEAFIFEKPSNDKRIYALLTDGECLELPSLPADFVAVAVCPRFGTISPWSSKTADIVANCQIDAPRIERVLVYGLPKSALNDDALSALHDRMTQSICTGTSFADVLAQNFALFGAQEPQPLQHIDVLEGGVNALQIANQQFGFALSDDEMGYLVENYQRLGKNPTDAELMMFAQANSEHCRHKIFNADFHLDGDKQVKSLFGMIKNTYQQNPNGVISAYHDNAAVTQGAQAPRFFAKDGRYNFATQQIDILMKVETHNHPTAIAPFAGAATGAGSEIRDEGATGRGGKPKAGLVGFSVSHLHLDSLPEKWELKIGKPSHIASAQQIMLEAPLGSSAFGNEFGRPTLAGYFRVFADKKDSGYWGYHKPIMIAGGLGNIERQNVQKGQVADGDLLIVLGGPAMQIGLGGGAASSMAGGNNVELDFASVQRDNAEMERRCQEVIDACWALDDNPITFIHDVGAGGLSNALPELVGDNGLGAQIDIRNIPSIEHGMAPMAIWSNEAQERYMLSIKPQNLAIFEKICQRERAPFAVLGVASSAQNLHVSDSLLGDDVVDMPMSVLLGGLPKLQKNARTRTQPAFDSLGDIEQNIDIKDSFMSVLRHPSVASKSFLISINDRTVGGMTAQDQYVGRYQAPVADCAVTAVSLYPMHPMRGEAMAMGERAPIATIDAAASARMAVGEAITNIASARIDKLSDMVLSANWMAACGDDYMDGDLFTAVQAIGMDLCPKLGINIPVGKDSLSMRTRWVDDSAKEVVAPLSVVISAFAPAADVAQTLTPNLCQDSTLYHINLGQARLGGSIFAQIHNLCLPVPDVDADLLARFFNAIQQAHIHIHAYHDISDGGIGACVAEMLFCDRMGANIYLDSISALFAEELGAVVAVLPEHEDAFLHIMQMHKLDTHTKKLGQAVRTNSLSIDINGNKHTFTRVELERAWSAVSHAMSAKRDNPSCADEAFALIDSDKAGIVCSPTFDLTKPIEAPTIIGTRPKVAILREQGVNGHMEMAAGFHLAGFESVDVHMSDLHAGRIDLADMQGLVACGGFSYGDVLGAGAGWAKSILFSEKLAQMFSEFFHRNDTFSLGVCNGCQMMAQLKDLIPQAEHFPRFGHNKSMRFEARVASVEILPSKSVLLQGMAGSILPIAVAHGEGLALINNTQKDMLLQNGAIMRYVDGLGEPTQTYPLNPNGSLGGITGITSLDGRATIMMPHPERTLHAHNHSYAPSDWRRGAWFKLFENAAAFTK